MKSARVFLIHGFGGEPYGGWRPWLLRELAKHDIWAVAPAMPDTDNPQKNKWVAEIARQVGTPDEGVVLVGHSLGVLAVLHYLESLKGGESVGGAVLVAGPFENLTSEKYDPMANFFETTFDFSKIKNACKKFVVVHGENDDVVLFDDAEKFASALSCELVTVPNKKHLNENDDCYELPEALTALLSVISL